MSLWNVQLHHESHELATRLSDNGTQTHEWVNLIPQQINSENSHVITRHSAHQRIYSSSLLIVRWTALIKQRQGGIQSKCYTKRSELPQHGNRSADAYIVVIEVAKPSKGQSWDCQEACLGSLLQCVPMNVVSNHLSNAPVTVQGEGCSQRVVHHRAGIQVPSWNQAQEQNTDNPLTGPVERCGLGTSYKKNHIHMSWERTNTSITWLPEPSER